jgi:hypothetical protein
VNKKDRATEKERETEKERKGARASVDKKKKKRK